MIYTILQGNTIVAYQCYENKLRWIVVSSGEISMLA